MATYAEINTDNIVVNCIIADAEFVASQNDKTYVLCTRGGIGWTYNSEVDVFVAPQPYPSWRLDENHDWQPPTPMPTDGERYLWNEEELVWVAI
jgi:hypothetical protein